MIICYFTFVNFKQFDFTSCGDTLKILLRWVSYLRRWQIWGVPGWRSQAKCQSARDPSAASFFISGLGRKSWQQISIFIISARSSLVQTRNPPHFQILKNLRIKYVLLWMWSAKIVPESDFDIAFVKHHRVDSILFLLSSGEWVMLLESSPQALPAMVIRVWHYQN